jgi:modified peptide precursor CbpA
MAMQKQQHESERNGRPSVSKDKVVKNVRAIRKSCSALGTGLSHFFAKEKGAVR